MRLIGSVVKQSLGSKPALVLTYWGHLNPNGKHVRTNTEAKVFTTNDVAYFLFAAYTAANKISGQEWVPLSVVHQLMRSSIANRHVPKASLTNEMFAKALERTRWYCNHKHLPYELELREDEDTPEWRRIGYPIGAKMVKFFKIKMR